MNNKVLTSIPIIVLKYIHLKNTAEKERFKTISSTTLKLQINPIFSFLSIF